VDRPGHLQPQPHQSRQRRSLLPQLQEPALDHCLPMAICQWRQVLVAAAQRGMTRKALVAAAEGLGAGWRMLVLGWAPAAVRGLGEAEDQAVGQVAVALQLAPWGAIKSNRAIQSLPGDAGSKALYC
jgi:hypothetical protein